MFPSPPTLQPGETILKSGIVTRYGFSKSLSATLTDKRLIFKNYFIEEWFPLSHIKSVSKSGNFVIVKFDNGYTEEFSISTAEEWLAEIEQTRVDAPAMEFAAQAPSPRFGITRSMIILLAAGGVIGFTAVCCLVGAAILYFR